MPVSVPAQDDLPRRLSRFSRRAREWHGKPNNTEWLTYIEFSADWRVRAHAGAYLRLSAGDDRLRALRNGSLKKFETSEPHRCRFLEIIKSRFDADVSLNQWLELTPPELCRRI